MLSPCPRQGPDETADTARHKVLGGPGRLRKRMHIAWTQVAEQYPDEMLRGSSRIHEADIVQGGDGPRLANRKVVLESRDLPFRCTLECQNFVPPAERELTFSAYGYQTTDVCGIDLETKKITNYSDAADQYDEPEGVFPDGRSTLVECDREGQSGRGPGHVDIWKLSLDGRRTWERLTYFNKYPGYKASNPVVSDDGKLMAFQTARSSDPAGVGYGIFLFDFAKAALALICRIFAAPHLRSTCQWELAGALQSNLCGGRVRPDWMSRPFFEGGAVQSSLSVRRRPLMTTGLRQIGVPGVLGLIVILGMAVPAFAQIPGLPSPVTPAKSAGVGSSSGGEKPKAAVAATAGPITVHQQVPDRTLEHFLGEVPAEISRRP